MSPVIQLAIVLSGMILIMIGLWIIQRRTHDAGIVDVGWSAGIGAAALFYSISSPGLGIRRLLLAVLSSFWAIRLAGYLLVNRILKEDEDGRYRTLREKWGTSSQRNFFLFFLFQAGLVVLFSLPHLVVAHNPVPALTAWDIAGVVVFIVSFTGEAIADKQLAAFRADHANEGKTCRSGLWRYSRHPNYFFEWTHWWTYVLLAIGSTFWWVTLAGPALMLLFLYKITGIPATEARAILTRGDEYLSYQRSTSQFFPWFPKED